MEGENLMEALVRAGVVSSKSDYRRLADEGAIENLETGEKITEHSYAPEKNSKYKVGKRRFVKIN